MATKITRKQIVLRVPAALNSAVRSAAKKSGQSINSYVEDVLGKRVGVKAKAAKPAKR
jgi:predicted HicB family RNase H-like nuclease